MIKVVEVGDVFANIDKYKLDGIMNAANGVGPMGRGIAGAITKHGGKSIQKEAVLNCLSNNPSEGDAYSTNSGSLITKGIKAIIHAVTMKEPGGPTSLAIVAKAFNSALKLSNQYGIKKLGCTALGTGVGKLSPNLVGVIMQSIAEANKDVEVYFFDFDQKFINSIKNNSK